MKDDDRVTLLEALSRFDNLAKRFANEDGGRLNDKKKALLDAALDMHAQASAKLKIDPGMAVPEFDIVSA